MQEKKTERIKVTRFLIYEGTPKFVCNSIKNRSVKGTMETPSGCIKEGFVGDIDYLELPVINGEKIDES